MPTFTRRGLAFHYESAGQGTPIVFRHGLGGSVAQPLGLLGTPEGVQLSSLDARGHGATAPLGPPAALGFTTFADDVIALLDTLQLERPVVGGISMGAGVALNLAARFPERVAALILVRPAWLEVPDPPHLAVYSHVARLIRQFGALEGQAHFETSAAYAEISRVSAAAAKSLLGQFTRPHAEAYIEVLETLPADIPVQDRAWRRLQVPTLVLGAPRDPNHPLELARTLAREIPAAEFHELTPRDLSPQRYEADTRNRVLTFIRASA